MPSLDLPYSATMPAPLIIAILVVSWRGGQLSWLCTDFFATLFIGISLFLTPRLLLEYQTDVRLDNVSVHLARVLGALLLSLSMNAHRVVSSGSKKEWASIFRSRVFTAITLLLATIYAQQHYREWNFRLTPCAIVASASWLLPHLHFSLATTPISKAAPRPVHFFLLLDYFITATAGIAWYAYPHWLLRMLIQIKPNGVSVTMARMIGSMLIALASESGAATYSDDFSSQKLIHRSRIITGSSLMCLLLYAETLHKAFNHIHVIIGTCTVFVWTVNAILGYIIVAYAEMAREKEQKVRESANSCKLKVNLALHSGNFREPVTWETFAEDG